METISLSSGPTINDPFARLIKFCQAEYQYYDNVPTGDPNSVLPVDVLATVGVNSFINSAQRVRAVHLGMSAECDALLAAIPHDADLMLVSSLLPVYELLSAAMKTKFVGLAVATKVLHRKRSCLIPMLDNVVARHYLDLLDQRALFTRALGGSREASRQIAELVLPRFRDDLQDVQHEILSLRTRLERSGFFLSHVRILEILVWTETEDRAYYR